MSYENINKYEEDLIELRKRDFSGTMYDQNKSNEISKLIKKTFSQIQESADYIEKKYFNRKNEPGNSNYRHVEYTWVTISYRGFCPIWV